ncbi:hypothetical protein [Chakrabartyella piscis]|uniref:hypothetical protein n=1 Tax=Chakrabartyella piscis TaxID=2918914 RepID=UPI002958CB1D|nr:hypothetical protein [Chakrabartyella piscis]
MKKKKYVIFILFLICAILLTFYYRAVIPIAKNIDYLEIYSISLYTENGDRSDITSSVNIDKVEETLVQYDCELHTTNFAPYPHSKVKYELNGTYDGKPLHILLGDLNIVYEDASSGGHSIVNPNELMVQLEQYIA